MFMTTGIFLMRLVNNPDSLAKYTHIIMDEVHERDLDTDFSLVVLKHLLGKQGEGALNFKLILMSATFNTQLFANYFSKSSIAQIEEIETYKGAAEKQRLDSKKRKEISNSKENGEEQNQVHGMNLLKRKKLLLKIMKWKIPMNGLKRKKILE